MKRILFALLLLSSFAQAQRTPDLPLYTGNGIDSALFNGYIGNHNRGIFGVDIFKASYDSATDHAQLIDAINGRLTPSGAATVTGKTIDGDDNTLQDIAQSSVKGLGDSLLSKADTAKLMQWATYVVGKSGSTTYARPRYTSGLPVYSGSTASTVINSAIAALPSKGTIYIQAFDYTISSSIVDGGKSNVSLIFERGAKFTAADSLNAPVIYITNVSHWRIDGAEIDGNATMQRAPILAGGTYPDGIWGSTVTDMIVSNAYIHDCRRFGANFDETSLASGIRDSYVTNIGWNCVNLGNAATDKNLFAIGNDLSHASDVGLANYGTGSRVIGNAIHDIDGTTGYNGAEEHDGMSIEGGGGNIITDNYIYNVNNCLLIINAWDKNKISNNYFKDWDVSQTYQSAIICYSDSNDISNNDFTSTRAIGYGIKLEGANKNNLSNNRITCNVGFRLGSGSDNNNIHGNTVRSKGDVALRIASSDCDTNKFWNNDISGSTSATDDSGTGTVYGTNIWTDGRARTIVAEYTDNAAAVAAGLSTGSLYRTGDQLKIVH